MVCCFSNLKQLFARGQELTDSFADISRYYRTYLELMRHWDTVLPGRINCESVRERRGRFRGKVERILDFCGLAFEPACVPVPQTERAVPTASSEQGSPANFLTWAFPVEELRALARPAQGRFGRRTESIPLIGRIDVLRSFRVAREAPVVQGP